MAQTLPQAFLKNFLGQAPQWYKNTILIFLVLNPILLVGLGSNGPYIVGWLLILEFIFTLAMALKCYPLQPGGLLALEAVLLGMTTADGIKEEILKSFSVILLLVFMVAGIYFMKKLLLFVFTKILIGIRSKTLLSLLFCAVSAVLSAFLDALTVTAVLIGVFVGFYSVYHKVASGSGGNQHHDHGDDDNVHEYHREDLDQFRTFLCSLVMHGAVGTALGGVCTLVGEPQNLLIAERASWEFMHFVHVMAPVTMPVLAAGLLTCILLEKIKLFGYGSKLPESVRSVLEDYEKEESAKRSKRDQAELIVQGIAAVILVLSLAFHVAEVGVIGLMIIVLQTAFNGVTDEHQIGAAFEEALPFTALLVVFFTIVSVIHQQHLFAPITDWVMAQDPNAQPAILFLANGALSAISDNVFVATVYIDQVKEYFDNGQISRDHFDALAVAINTGTNLPSVATPNGQAAFLFLLTSALAPLIRLSYGRMVLMALPYTIVLTIVGLLCVSFFLE